MKKFLSMSVALLLNFVGPYATAEPLSHPFLTGDFQWKSSPAFISPAARAEDPCEAIKDPSVVFHEGKWHVFATIRSHVKTHQVEYLNFTDWREANSAQRHILQLPDAYACAPQVFYHSSLKKWCLLYQIKDPQRQPSIQPALVMSDKLDDPTSWSQRTLLWDQTWPNCPRAIDFWIIGDDTHARLFFTSNNGKLWRSDSPLTQFPKGFGEPKLVLQGDFFEASCTYRLKGSDQFLTLIEAERQGIRRYLAWTAPRLDAEWKPLAATWDKAFASRNNVTFPEGSSPWSESISHGELLRSGIDEKMEIDSNNLRFLYQGARDEEIHGREYGKIPWRLGLLDAVSGQTAGKPAIDLIGGAEYPKIEADGRVTFRLKAPEAKQVKLEGGDGLIQAPLEMRKEGDGHWMATTPVPAAPGFHYHWFMVDGLRVNDPATATFFGWGRETSGVEVPDPAGYFYAFHPDIPQGSVSEYYYQSKSTGKRRRAHVYTPAAYASSDGRFPVLYLLHGAGESERSWVEQGKLQFIMDNLIASGKTIPMLVVADSGYAAYPNAAQGDWKASTSAFEDVLLQELVPAIDARYRTLSTPNKRALAGLSMGGGQALRAGLTHPETFSWIGAMSAPMREGFDLNTSFDGTFKDPAAFTQRFRLLWLSAGEAEKPFLTGVQSLHDTLTKAHIPASLYISPGTSHEWQTWRRSLAELSQKLFR